MTACFHERTGRVTTHPGGYTNGAHAATGVCNLPECIAEALAWAERMTGLPAFHVRDEVTR